MKKINEFRNKFTDFLLPYLNYDNIIIKFENLSYLHVKTLSLSYVVVNYRKNEIFKEYVNLYFEQIKVVRYQSF